jgi:hypothetical protein
MKKPDLNSSLHLAKPCGHRMNGICGDQSDARTASKKGSLRGYRSIYRTSVLFKFMEAPQFNVLLTKELIKAAIIQLTALVARRSHYELEEDPSDWNRLKCLKESFF